MKKLEYVGPKPLISHRGIDFDKNHDDKFHYLPVLIELIKALDHDYFENKHYIFEAHPKELTTAEIMKNLEHYCHDLDALIEQTSVGVEEHISQEMTRIQQSETLSSEDKIVFQNNLKIMHDYLLQFAINEAVYNCALKKLAQIVTKDHIDYITVPMFQRFAYVLHNLQALLQDQEHPIDTNLEIIEENGEMIAKLKVISLV